MPSLFSLEIKITAVLLTYLWLYIKGFAGLMHDPRNEFYHHELIKPLIYSATERKDELLAKDLYEDEVTVDFKAFNKKFVINLYMNKNLLSKNYFEKYQSNDEGNNEGSITFRPMKQTKERHCHYHGQIGGFNSSWAALSLCKGISGVIHDGKEMYYIEPDHRSDSNSHFVFKGSDSIRRNVRCGVKDEQEHVEMNRYPMDLQKVSESKNFKIPYITNETPLIIEDLYFVSNREYRKYGQDVTNRMQQIANLVNAVYAPLNIVVVLIGIIIWDRQDEIDIVPNSDQVLENFLAYRKRNLQKYPNDNAMIFTAEKFDDGVVGKAHMFYICRDQKSAEVIADFDNLVTATAMTAAHELGHNFGMFHDHSEKCICPSGKKKCIMHSSVSSPPPTQWSDCSLRYLKEGIEKGAGYCMKNKPNSSVGPICGNGLVEEGEQCDCGPVQFCKNPCCNAATCRLASNAACATGRCCDVQTCQIKRAGTVCRDRATTCDLPEFCDGSSEFCPENTYRQNGISCGRSNEGFCYGGVCNSHDNQCKLLWGPTGQMADTRCYDKNTEGNRNFNCGTVDITAEKFKSCEKEDILCGRVQCVDTQTEFQFGDRVDFNTSKGYVNINRKWYTCSTAVVDLGPGQPDPGLAPDGAKCGTGKACLNQRCVSLSQIKGPDCPANCSNNGVCNNKGNCHCNKGYGPLDCRNPGNGGSIDSGPAS